MKFKNHVGQYENALNKGLESGAKGEKKHRPIIRQISKKLFFAFRLRTMDRLDGYFGSLNHHSAQQ
jgi:hypothetical protein